MRLVKMLCCGFVSFVLLGCASYQVNSSQAVSANLEKNELVYIALTPGDFASENKQAQAALKTALSAQSVRAIVGNYPLSLNSALGVAQRIKAGYLMQVAVKKWEDHNTPWSTIRDKVVLEVVVMDTANKGVVRRDIVDGKSTTWTFKNNTPDVILPDMMQQYVEGLYK